MPNGKLNKQFDYYKPGSKMMSYPKGFDGDMPQAHYDAAVAAGAVDGAKASATGGDAGGGGGAGGAGGGPK